MRIWKVFLLQYRWIRHGDPSPVSFFESYSPEVIKKDSLAFKIKKALILLKLICKSIRKTYTNCLTDNRLLIPDEPIGLEAPRSNYYKCSINRQWKNAFCMVECEEGIIKLKIDNESSGIYFYIGRKAFSKLNADLKIHLEIGSYVSTILYKKTNAIHNNWDLFFYEFNAAERTLLGSNEVLCLKWEINVPNSRIYISAPFLKRNLKKTHKIIVLVADSVRPKDIGIYGNNENTRNIDSLFSDGAVFTNSFSQSNWTLPTVASMGTSLYASQHNVVNPNLYHKTIDRTIPTLAEVLKMNGFYNYAEMTAKRCSPGIGHHRGFDHFMYKKTNVEDGNSMREQLRRAISILRNIKGVPMFIFLHILDTHRPYIFDNNSLISKNLLMPHKLHYYSGRSRVSLQSEEREYLKDRYFSKLYELDSELKELFSYVKDDNDTTLIMTSDHGDSFNSINEENTRSGLLDLTDTYIRTPFMIFSNAFPIEKGMHDSMVESSIDLLPTIFSLYNIKDNYRRSGNSIFSDEYKINKKNYAISENIYGKVYQLKIIDCDGAYIVFEASRDMKSYKINLSDMSIHDYHQGFLTEKQFNDRFQKHIVSSKLDQAIKTAAVTILSSIR